MTVIIVMGVTGAGKTEVGKALAKRIHATFADADDYHSNANKKKMAAGHPLTDEDRQPWLATLNNKIKKWIAQKTDAVLACSALKDQYRITLIRDTPKEAVRVVMLEPDPKILEYRVTHRHHEFMDPHLLQSQLDTLEVPKDALIIHNNGSVEDAAKEIEKKLA